MITVGTIKAEQITSRCLGKHVRVVVDDDICAAGTLTSYIVEAEAHDVLLMTGSQVTRTSVIARLNIERLGTIEVSGEAQVTVSL